MNDEEKLAQQLGARLRELEEEISPEESARLATVRVRALHQLNEPRRISDFRHLLWSPKLLGAGAFAVGALAISLYVFRDAGIEAMPDFAAPEFLAAQETELLQDLEFAAWIADLEDMNEPPLG